MTNILPGPALVTVFVNGIPSQSRSVIILPGYPIFLPVVKN
jgi:hypothetical protein